MLLAAGADVDAHGQDGWTPLHVVACEGHLKAMMTLLDRGAIRRAPDRRGMTPLHVAANSGRRAATALLLDQDVDVDVRTREFVPPKGTPRYSLTTSTIFGWAGWHIGGKVEKGQTPLHRAAFWGFSEVVELLLDRGADVNAVDARLQTPLHLAVARGGKHSAKILYARGADLALRDDQGRTPTERAGEPVVDDRNLWRYLRIYLWVIRLVKISTFPVRVALRALRAITGDSPRGGRPGGRR